jgi:hypothetical protein
MAGHMGCKWGLLKFREREIQREHGGVQVEFHWQRVYFSLSGAFKTYTNP